MIMINRPISFPWALISLRITQFKKNNIFTFIILFKGNDIK
jgi:hypothetical protein